MKSHPWTHGNTMVGFDPARRRLWLGGWRFHHGLSGALLAASGLGALVVSRRRWREAAGIGLTGALLMLHDWRDRRYWFRYRSA